MKEKIPVHSRSSIVGKTIGEIEKTFGINVVQVNNTSDRAFMFSWEIPEKNVTIKSNDEIVAMGEPRLVRRFSELAVSLN